MSTTQQEAMSEVCTCGGEKKIAEFDELLPCCGHLKRFHDPNNGVDDTHACVHCAWISRGTRDDAEIAELRRDLKRARIEMGVRLNPPASGHAPLEDFADGWQGKPLRYRDRDTDQMKRWRPEANAAGHAAAEAEIERRMKVEDAM